MIYLLNIRKSEYTKEIIDQNGKHIQMTLTSILPKQSSQTLIICSDHKPRSLNSSFHNNIQHYYSLYVCVITTVAIRRKYLFESVFINLQIFCDLPGYYNSSILNFIQLIPAL